MIDDGPAAVQTQRQHSGKANAHCTSATIFLLCTSLLLHWKIHNSLISEHFWMSLLLYRHSSHHVSHGKAKANCVCAACKFSPGWICCCIERFTTPSSLNISEWASCCTDTAANGIMGRKSINGMRRQKQTAFAPERQMQIVCVLPQNFCFSYRAAVSNTSQLWVKSLLHQNSAYAAAALKFQVSMMLCWCADVAAQQSRMERQHENELNAREKAALLRMMEQVRSSLPQLQNHYYKRGCALSVSYQPVTFFFQKHLLRLFSFYTASGLQWLTNESRLVLSPNGHV